MAVFVGIVTEDGKKLVLDYTTAFKAHYARFAGSEVEVEVRKRRTRRSDSQNAYWWGVVVPLLAEHCGYTRDEMHEALKVKFLGTEDLSKGLVRIGSTRKLNTQEFAELTERVMLWSIEELGVVIPSPERDSSKRTKPKARRAA